MGTDQIKYKISGGLKWRSGSESEYIPPQLFMAGFKLVLSTHASLSPVCKAPVSTSALYQPLFVRQAESHTSNNLTSHQFSPSGHVKAVCNGKGALCIALICCPYFRDKHLLVWKARCRPFTLFSLNWKQGRITKLGEVFRKVFWWANKERYMCGSEWVRAGSLVCERRLDEFQRSSRASGQIGYWSCLSTDFSKYLSVLWPARAWAGIHIVSSICISCL